MLVGLTVFAVAKNPIMHSFHIVKDRLAGDTWAGDTPRRVTADLKPILQPEDAIYVVGFQPAIYYLTGAVIPTRFAFTGMPSFLQPGRDGCPWIEPAVEMRRILDSRPRFIVVERGIFYAEMPMDVRRILDERLDPGLPGPRPIRTALRASAYPFERFVMNGGAPADLYEWSDTPSPTPSVAEH